MCECTVLPAKSDSAVMFCLQSYLMIDRSPVYESYPQERINTQVILSIRVCASGVYKLIFDLTIVNKRLCHCHPRLARQLLHMYGMLLTIISETPMQHGVLEEKLYSEWRAISDQPAVDVNWRLSLSITLSAQ